MWGKKYSFRKYVIEIGHFYLFYSFFYSKQTAREKDFDGLKVYLNKKVEGLEFGGKYYKNKTWETRILTAEFGPSKSILLMHIVLENSYKYFQDNFFFS